MASALDEHFGYLVDSTKIERYQEAISRAVRPEHLVLDLGCGSGVLGLMALRAGARKVIFVEEGVILDAARETIYSAGFADRAEFIQTNSYELVLPERADIVICDHVGFFGFDYGILDLLADARHRFLKPDGVIIPAEFELRLAPVESDECRQHTAKWRDGRVPEDFAWLASKSANTKHSVNIKSAELLAGSAALTTLRLGDETDPFLSWNAEFICERDGMLDGVVGWFDCLLFDDVRMTNSPAAADAMDRSQAFFPLEVPLSISAGDQIKVTVMARHRDNVIGWIIELPGSGQRFAHTTFNGLFLDQETLTRAHPERVAHLSEHGKARQLILSYCDGERTLADVQAIVLRDCPDLFPSKRVTTEFITAVLAADTRE